jgi:protein-S-isoprenylcysteine O-methyltransferase Ste14
MLAAVLVNDMERSGNWLFRYRNHLPLLLLPLMAIALRHSEGIERRFGSVAEAVWESACVAVVLAGFAVRCLVVGYSFPGASGRNSRAQQAVSLNTRGMYSVVRHPLYLGNFLMMVGAISMIEVWWLTLVAVLAFLLYYERIIVAEEAFLANRFGTRYQEWAAVTPALIPAITRWQTPRVPFSVKRVLVRETPTFAQIVVVVTLIDFACDWAVWGRLERDDFLLAVAAGLSLLLYFVVRAIRKNTRWLSTAA